MDLCQARHVKGDEDGARGDACEHDLGLDEVIQRRVGLEGGVNTGNGRVENEKGKGTEEDEGKGTKKKDQV